MTLHIAGGVKIVMKNFRKISKFFAPKFFWPKLLYFDIIRPEMMHTSQIKIFGKIKILTPLIGPSVRQLLTKVLGQTDWLTDKQARPSCKNPPYPEEISIHQNGLTSILLHYDFELEAICFEPLVSRSLSFVLLYISSYHVYRGRWRYTSPAGSKS